MPQDFRSNCHNKHFPIEDKNHKWEGEISGLHSSVRRVRASPQSTEQMHRKRAAWSPGDIVYTGEIRVSKTGGVSRSYTDTQLTFQKLAKGLCLWSIPGLKIPKR